MCGYEPYMPVYSLDNAACLSHANLTSCVPYATAFVLPIEIFLGVSLLTTTRADLFHAQTILAEGPNDCAR